LLGATIGASRDENRYYDQRERYYYDDNQNEQNDNETYETTKEYPINKKIDPIDNKNLDRNYDQYSRYTQ
jgi:hypothetical protein